MMHRRSLLGLIGLGTVAAVVPAVVPVPAIAQPKASVVATLAKVFVAPLFADIALVGGRRYTVPVEPAYVEGEDMVLWLNCLHTGTVERITFRRGRTELLYMSGNDLPSPHTLAGSALRIAVGSLPA